MVHDCQVEASSADIVLIKKVIDEERDEYFVNCMIELDPDMFQRIKKQTTQEWSLEISPEEYPDVYKQLPKAGKKHVKSLKAFLSFYMENKIVFTYHTSKIHEFVTNLLVSHHDQNARPFERRCTTAQCVFYVYEDASTWIWNHAEDWFVHIPIIKFGLSISMMGTQCLQWCGTRKASYDQYQRGC